jgi:hypothetical protein
MQRIEMFSGFIAEVDQSARPDAAKLTQILSGLSRRAERISKEVEGSSSPVLLSRFAREYDRLVRYLNVAVIHSINPWLERQTRGLTREFEFREEEVMEAIRAKAVSQGLDWAKDVERCEAHRVRGTLGCRALLQLVDGSSKVVLLEYDRRQRMWQVKHFGPRLTELIGEAVRRFGRNLPKDYDEKFEQPTFSLDEQSCRFLMLKRGVARVEATLVLDATQLDKPWKLVYLKWNDEILVDRANPLDAISA